MRTFISTKQNTGTCSWAVLWTRFLWEKIILMAKTVADPGEGSRGGYARPPPPFDPLKVSPTKVAAKGCLIDILFLTPPPPRPLDPLLKNIDFLRQWYSVHVSGDRRHILIQWHNLNFSVASSNSGIPGGLDLKFSTRSFNCAGGEIILGRLITEVHDNLQWVRYSRWVLTVVRDSAIFQC